MKKQNIKKLFLFRLVLEQKVKGTLAKLTETTERYKLLEKIFSKISGVYYFDGKALMSSNIENITKNCLYFQFGAQTKKGFSEFNSINNTFNTEEKDYTEYTDCFYLVNEQVLGIIENKNFGTTKSIASNFSAYVNQFIKNNINIFESDKATLENLLCKSRPIFVPNKFVKEISKACVVQRFSISFLPSNPLNFKDEIQNPVDKFMKEIGASDAKLSVGNNESGLNTERLVSLTYDLAAYGAGASASIKKDKESKFVSIKLDDDKNEAYITVAISSEKHGDKLTISEKTNFFEKIMKKFNEIYNDERE